MCECISAHKGKINIYNRVKTKKKWGSYKKFFIDTAKEKRWTEKSTATDISLTHRVLLQLDQQ